MRRVFGPRTVVEAAFLIAVPVVAAALGFSTWTIIAASAVAYLLIFVLEATLWREGTPAPGLSRLRLPARNVRVKPPAAPAEPEPEPEVVVVSKPVVAPVTAPAPVTVDRAHDHVRVLPKTPEPAPEPAPPAVAPAPEPEPQPVPEPVVEYAPLTAVPEPEPVPVPVAVAVAPPEPQTVVAIGVSAVPRQWNLWELERLTRESAGDDVVRDEERQFLLMYLREFADSDGQLPVDFDGLVRDSFGELVGAR
jgi:outer membrane biosynthesis protein TonB